MDMSNEEKTLDSQLLLDHQMVKDLYAEYKKSGDVMLVMKLVWELTRHSIGEEILVYPLLEKLGDSTVAQLKAEHKEVATLADKLNAMVYPSEEFDKAFDDVVLHINEHVEKEESEDIPLLASKLPMEERILLGTKFMGRKKIEPTRQKGENPHLPALKEACDLLLGPVDQFRPLFEEMGSASAAGPSSTSSDEKSEQQQQQQQASPESSSSAKETPATDKTGTDAKEEDSKAMETSEHEEEEHTGEEEESTTGESVSAAAGKRQTKKRAASPSASTSAAPKKTKAKRGSAKQSKKKTAATATAQ